MMLVDHLVERIRRYKPVVNKKLLETAYNFAAEKHKDQWRASGEPFFSHPIAVANILIDMHLDETTIAVALLHDTIEDTTATREEIEQIFGAEFGPLVEGLTKLKQLDHYSKKAIQGENLRKLLVATSKDVRILLVKLADRLHNMRTLGAVASEKQLRIAQETMDLYVPLADRIGMRDMRGELEDLAFCHLNHEAYVTITERLERLSRKSQHLLVTIKRVLDDLFKEKGLKAVVSSRQKRPYAVFHKMQTKGIAFEQLSDIYGFRVIVENIEDCYRVLGLIHAKWSMVPGRFKDYISLPKSNDYRSIHTTIIGPESQRVELQIRTQEMDEIAEYGLAAHPLYKEIGSRPSATLLNELNAYAWIRKTLQMLAEGDNPEEFLEHTKLELFEDQVFCFTPGGNLITLPQNATPIDFAYAIHTDIGNSCIGVKINGRPMPLIFPLKNGDEVEIICSEAKTPVAAWADLVKTGKARAAIRRATRTSTHKQYCALGQDILRHHFEQVGKGFYEEDLALIVSKFGQSKLDDLYIAVGKHEIAPEDVLKTAYPQWAADYLSGEGLYAGSGKMFTEAAYLESPVFLNQRQNNLKQYVVPIGWRHNYESVIFCPNGAIPGDSIVGLLQDNGQIIVYPINSQALVNQENEGKRWIEMRWNVKKGCQKADFAQETLYFPVRICVFLLNSVGAFAQISAVLARQNANILYINTPHQLRDYAELNLVIEVEDDKHLQKIFAQLLETRMVSLVKRLYS